MSDINICLACDDNYARYAGVVIASVLANAASNEKLHFFILDGGITPENHAKLEALKDLRHCDITFVPIDEALFEDYKKVKTHEYITLATYYRLKISSLLPQVDRVIYMDCDVVVNHSLSELFNSDLGESAIAGVSDLNKRRVRKNPTYVNAGMLIMDIANIRKYDLEKRFLDYTRKNIDHITCGDQEIINEVCKGEIKLLDESWNVQSSNFVNRSSYTPEPRIIHFVARRKPWHGGSLSVHRDLYFNYLQMTPWALSAKELEKFEIGSKRALRLAYFKYRPFFWLRPRFYAAWFKTGGVFSYRESIKRRVCTICGIKFTFRKNRYSEKQLIRINSGYENGQGVCPRIKDRKETLAALLNSNKSIARFGDGEFNLILGEDLPFQKFSPVLQQRLKEILRSENENLLVAIPNIFGSLAHYRPEAESFWRRLVVSVRNSVYSLLNMDKLYFDAEVSRPYMNLADKSEVDDFFRNFRNIWEKRNIVLVEGEMSRLGTGNDLFANAASVKRIVCPAQNAFGCYAKILTACKKQPADTLFIIALGPTATVLASDLSEAGFRALDLGHIDIEYEWFLQKAERKVAVPGKYVNEVKSGRKHTTSVDAEYLEQIIETIS